MCISTVSLAQTKDELEKQRKEAQEIIEKTTILLQQTSHTRSSSLDRLNLVNRRLQIRQNLINSIQLEIKTIDNSLFDRQNRIIVLNNELEESRISYANLIRIAYKHRFAHHRLMFILSADDFNQGYRRLKYLQQYGHSRQKQIKRIGELTNSIILEIEKLEKEKIEKIVLLEQQRNETNLLDNEKRIQSSLVQDLRKKETELKREIDRQKQISQSLQRAIEELFSEDSKVIAERRIYELTPEEKLISSEFQRNKGVLPWPIERGFVTGYFGEHPHPVLRGIKIQNNGIDISTIENAEVRALFDGIVRQVITVPGANNVVLVRHGNYLTVYANLSHVYVRNGDKVSTKQLIGRVFTDNEEKSSTLHLEIWEENIKLDPMIWLSRQ